MGDIADYYIDKMTEDKFRPTGTTSQSESILEREDVLTVYKGSVVGVTFEPAKANLQYAAKHGHTDLTLKHRADNKYDICAISVVAGGKHIGWIPKPQNRNILQYGTKRVKCKFCGWNTYAEKVVGVSVEVTLH